jgi:hypothetical protein
MLNRHIKGWKRLTHRNSYTCHTGGDHCPRQPAPPPRGSESPATCGGQRGSMGQSPKSAPAGWLDGCKTPPVASQPEHLPEIFCFIYIYIEKIKLMKNDVLQEPRMLIEGRAVKEWRVPCHIEPTQPNASMAWATSWLA